MAKVLLVVAPERFRDEELFVTQEALREAGHDTLVASTSPGVCPGSRGGTVTAVGLADVDPSEFDAVVVVGGGGARLLFDDAGLQELLRTAYDQGKIVAAICLAPVVLARAGLLAGRRATVAGTMSGEIEQHGATYDGPGVTVDGTVVTANAPKASRAFGEAIAALLQ